jgi:hypothetical protein
VQQAGLLGNVPTLEALSEFFKNLLFAIMPMAYCYSKDIPMHFESYGFVINWYVIATLIAMSIFGRLYTEMKIHSLVWEADYFLAINSKTKKNMKETLLKKARAIIVMVVTLLSLTLPSHLLAYDFEVDGIYYNITSTTKKTCEVTYETYSYETYHSESPYSGSIAIPEKVNYNGKDYSVTSIGQKAFDNCIGLTSVSIPNSVTSIGYYAFYGCTGLTEVNLPNSITEIGNYVFLDCTGLTKVVIPDSVTKICYMAFDGCTSLTSVTIPNTVTSIGTYAFYKCSALEEITIPSLVTSIGTYTFYGCSSLTSVTIPNSVNEIGTEAFNGCSGINDLYIEDSETELKIGTSAFKNVTPTKAYIGRNLSSTIFKNNSDLTSLTIGDKVTSIGSSAFSNCSGLTEITIPSSVTTIGNYAYQGCTGLTEITIPSSVTTIGNYAFQGCTGLTEITIPSSVTTIGNCAFQGCTGLTDVTIPSSITTIDGNVFSGCTGLTEITIPNSVTTIGSSAFSGCTGLTEITIPNSVTSIGSSAFSSCTGLASVTIPNSVTSIGDYAFSGCTGLTEITIPNSVTSIGSDVFYGCTGLTSVTIPNSVTTIGARAFYKCTALTEITIPDSVTDLGLSAFWGCSGLTSAIIGNSVTSIGSLTFYECTGLTSLVIGSSVTEIGENAFYKCSGLKWVECLAVTPPTLTSSSFYIYTAQLFAANEDYKTADRWSSFKNITCPYNPSGMTFEVDGLKYAVTSAKTCCLYAIDEDVVGDELIIPETVEYSGRQFTPNEIKYGSIYGTSAIKSITIPNSITTLESATIFKSNIEKIYVASDITSNYVLGSKINELVISSAVSNFGASLPTNSIKKIIIEDSDNPLTTVNLECKVKEVYLGRNISLSSTFISAFKNVTSLESVTISDNVTELASYVFYGCKGLTEVTIPSSVTSIGSSAFYYCTGLVSVTIPNSVTSIGAQAFYHCTSLKEIPIPSSHTSISIDAFSGCTSLTELVIPNTIASIGSGAFYGCDGLTSLTIEDGEESLSLGSNAFSSTSLKEAYFGRQMDFSYISFPALETVEFGENVTSIASGAFKENTAIRTVKSHNVTPPTAEDPFASETYLQGTLYVPNSSIKDYQNAAGWENFWTIEALEGEDSAVTDVAVDGEFAAGTIVDVYNLSGVQMMHGVEMGSISDLAAGVYIVRTATAARKIVVK